MDETTASAAIRHLDQADRAAAGVAARGAWISRYMAAFGLGFGAEAVLLGLIERTAVRSTAFSVTWVFLVAAMVLWSRRQPATARHAQRRMLPWWIGTVVLYATATVLGPVLDTHAAALWLPVGVLVAAPLLFGAWRERSQQCR